MSTPVLIALIAWLPLSLVVFATLPARRAALASVLGGWLFLPMAGINFPGLPSLDKHAFVSISALLGTAIFNPNALLAYRPKWIDLPILVWCTCPFASSVANNLGAYDGCVAVFHQVLVWGLPYLIGRIYITDLDGLHELAVGVVMSGLVYVPLCLFELRFSPQLHYWIYGFRQHEFLQQVRYGGYRPMVFMPHGLAVAFWMATCAVTAVGLWLSRPSRRVLGMSPRLCAGILAAMLLLCKTVGATILAALGLCLIFFGRRRGLITAMVLLAVAPALYSAARSLQILSADRVLAAFPLPDTDRQSSLQFRLENEDRLATKALAQPLFGWGGWGRSRVYDQTGKDISTTDGLWIIALGTNGVLGLTALLAVFATPVLTQLSKQPREAWARPATMPVVAGMLVANLAALNNLPNADANPAFMVIVGALGALPTIVVQPAQSGLRQRKRFVRSVAIRPKSVIT